MEFQTTGDGASFKGTVGQILALVPGGTTAGVQLGFANVKDVAYGATGNGTTDDRAAIQAAIDALPVRGGTVYFPAGVYLIKDSLNINDRAYVTFLGQSSPGAANQIGNTGNWNNGPSTILMDSLNTVGARTKPIVVITTTAVATSSGQTGGFLFEKLYLRPYAYNYNVTYSGPAIVCKKKKWANSGGIANNGNIDDFWGYVTVRDCKITGASCAVLMDDSFSTSITTTASLNGTGFGWLTIDSCHFSECQYGLYANCQLNVVRVVNSNLSSCGFVSAGASTYDVRTGGAIVLMGAGNGLMVHGCDLEGSQVGIHAVGVENLSVDTCWFEGMYDLSMFLGTCKNVTVRNCSIADTDQCRTFYAYNCERITLERNRVDNYGVLTGGAWVLGPWNKEVVTDTPEFTRFSMSMSHSKTLTGYGFVIQKMGTFGKQLPVRPESRMTLASAGSATFTGESFTGHGGNAKRRTMGVDATSNNGGFSALYLTNTVVQKDEWVVTTLVVKPHQANGSQSQLYMSVYDAESTGTPTPVVTMDLVFDYLKFQYQEWVAVQWCRKKSTANTQANYQAYFTIGQPVASGVTKLLFDGIAMCVAPHPFIRPTGWEICNPNGTEVLYTDGTDYYGILYPVWSGGWVWRVGEKVYNIAPVAGGSMGWVCTTGGIGGVAVWKEFGLIEA